MYRRLEPHELIIVRVQCRAIHSYDWVHHHGVDSPFCYLSLKASNNYNGDRG